MADTRGAETIARNISILYGNIRKAAERVGREPTAVRLIAATKFVSVDRIRQAIEAGVRIFGENRLQEALPKIEALGSSAGVRWHFIGKLQRRKVKTVVGRFEMIHSVDSVELATEVDRRAAEAGVCQAVLLEVNIGGEQTKAGFTPEGVAEALPTLDAMAHLAVKGLMVMPPPTPEPEGARPYFSRARALATSLARMNLRRIRFGELSMGMSHDYEIAVEEGATMVRVGSAIFGERPNG